MSAFLGPIHFWMYHKIQVQQGIVEDMIELGKELVPDLKESLDQKYGESETRPLEEVIDEGNIHGWLQQHVSQVEYKLADSITTLTKINEDLLSKVESVFYENGKKLGGKVELTSASEAYKLLNDSLLDGMPCDHVNSLVKDSAQETIWRRTSCVHGSYWDQVGGNVDLYYRLRDHLVQGLLEGTDFVYEKLDESTSKISMK